MIAPLARHPRAARFVARPHRFAALVRLRGGAVVEAHLPNPGRLTGTLSPGCRVWIDGPFPPPRKLAWTLVAAEAGATVVGTIPAYANQVFPALWCDGLFPELAGAELRAEVTHGASRFDFQCGGTLVEVKSVTFARAGAGLFPDAVTARGARHARSLAALARSGRPAAIVFVAQRGDVESVAPAVEIDPEFARALAEAAEAGVQLLACALEMAPGGAAAAWRVPAAGPARGLDLR